MGVTFIAKEGTYTAPAKLTTKTITENGTYSAVDDSANGYSSVTVNVEGGGGSSDFSTALLTDNTDGEFQIYAATISSDSEMSISNGYGNPVQIILYKGKAFVTLDGNHTPILSGGIEYNADLGGYVVTGDCSISL